MKTNETINTEGIEVCLAPGVQLAPEVEAGNREYKLMLTNMTDETRAHRITQLNWRLNEGNGEAFYMIGVEDDGNQLGLTDEELQESLGNLQAMANEVGCDMSVRQLSCGVRGRVAEVHMKRRERPTVDVAQISVAVAGQENAGKSSLIGVLCSGRLDSGRGSARSTVCTHNHELMAGKTSCISHRSLHFSKDGQVLNAQFLLGSKGNSLRQRALSDMELADCTHRVVNLIDLAGAAKYLRTTLHGLIGRRPQYSMVCLSAVASSATVGTSMTSEHIGVSLYLKVPLVIVITKTDIASAHQIASTMHSVTAVLKEAAHEVALIDSAAALAAHLNAEHQSDVVPVFQVSNVTGAGLELLQSFLCQLPNAPSATVSGVEQQQQQQGSVGSMGSGVREGVRVRLLTAIGRLEEPDADEDDLSPEEEVEAVSTRRCRFDAQKRSENVHTMNRGGQVAASRRELPPVALVSTSPGQPIHSGGTSTDSLCGQLGGGGETSVSAAVCAEFSQFIQQGESEAKVLVGFIETGVLALRDTLVFGPTAEGAFVPVEVTSIRVNNVPVQFGGAGQTVTFKLSAARTRAPMTEAVSTKDASRGLKRSTVKGLVLASPSESLFACWEFEAELLFLNHPNKIRVNYEPVVHIGCVTQCARIISIRKEGGSRTSSRASSLDGASGKSLRDLVDTDDEEGDVVVSEIGNGEKAVCRFRFLYYPEVLTAGSALIIREERIKGVGRVVDVVK